MSALQFGLTPKMKPLPPKRSVLVAALDVGTSKIACMIGRLKPRAPQDVLRRRSHSVAIVGFGHTVAGGMKAGAVIDLLKALPLEQQAAILSVPNAVVGLAFNGQAEAVVQLLGAMPPEPDPVIAQEPEPELPPDDDDVIRTERPLQFTSWYAIHRTLKSAFPTDRYHSGSSLIGFDQTAGCVLAHFADGGTSDYDAHGGSGDSGSKGGGATTPAPGEAPDALLRQN